MTDEREILVSCTKSSLSFGAAPWVLSGLPDRDRTPDAPTPTVGAPTSAPAEGRSRALPRRASVPPDSPVDAPTAGPRRSAERRVSSPGRSSEGVRQDAEEKDRGRPRQKGAPSVALPLEPETATSDSGSAPGVHARGASRGRWTTGGHHDCDAPLRCEVTERTLSTEHARCRTRPAGRLP